MNLATSLQLIAPTPASTVLWTKIWQQLTTHYAMWGSIYSGHPLERPDWQVFQDGTNFAKV